jgi:hypothetical protein
VHPNQAALSSNHRVVTLSGDSVAGGGAWDTIPFGKRVDPLIKVGTVPNPEKPKATLNKPLNLRRVGDLELFRS